nr:MAG TPA: protein of unknown function (DUF4971) [Caudoviricetes sp.]
MPNKARQGTSANDVKLQVKALTKLQFAVLVCLGALTQSKMKKVTLMMLAVALMLSSCAEKKTFKKCDGTSFVASPYGWANKEKQIDGVDYELNVPNIILSVIFSGTIVCPVVLTAVELWEPVNYTEPNTTK